MKKNEAFLMSFVALGLAVLGLILGGLALSNKSSAATGKLVKTVVDVTLEEFSIQPAHIVVKPGAVSLRVTNTGNLDHNFEVTGLGTLPALHAGETKTLELPVVSAGTYAVICTIPGHAASGMKAMLMSAGNADTSANAQAGSDPGQPVMDNNQMDQMMETAAKKFPEKTAGHGGDLLDPVVQAVQVRQLERSRHLVDEGRLLGNGVHTIHPDIRPADGDHNARKTGTRTDIQEADGFGRQTLQAFQGFELLPKGDDHCQTVQQMVGQHLGRVTHRRQVVDLVPFLDQVQIGQQGIHLGAGQVQPQRPDGTLKSGAHGQSSIKGSGQCRSISASVATLAFRRQGLCNKLPVAALFQVNQQQGN